MSTYNMPDGLLDAVRYGLCNIWEMKISKFDV